MLRATFVRRQLSACLAPVGVLLVSLATAEDTLDEIIVTADYRERGILDVPHAISVIDAATIEGTAVQHFEELVAIVPNMNWSGDGNRARYFQIRGVGELAQYQGAPNPSVGFLIDDIDFSGIGTVATLFDIQQIEVLRGPQGTRYGANALAGLVYVRSTEPERTSGGELRLATADDDALGVGAALGGAVGATGAYRLSAHHYRANGFRKNSFLGRSDTNGRDELTVRGKLRWRAGADWDLQLAGLYADVDDGYDAFAIDNSLTVLSDNPGRDSQRSAGASFRADWSGAEAFDLTLITSGADSDIDFDFDADWGNPDAWAPVIYDYVSRNNRQRTTISQELRLSSKDAGRLLDGRLDWLAGLYFNDMKEDLRSANLGDYYDPGFDFADSLDDRLTSSFGATNMAVFGQLEAAVGERGMLTAGLRLERRVTDYSDSNGLSLDPDETMWGGELGYRYLVNDAVSAFVTLAKGYKAGGFNLGFVPESARDFDQETLWNVETGVKSMLADGRLLVNASVFFSKREDQQVETSLQLNPNDPASFVFFTDNAAAGETIGLETEVRWLPSDSLELYANIGLMRARFTEFDNELVALDGRDQAHAPRYTLAAGAVYRHPDGFFARVDMSAKDEFYFDVSHNQRSAAYSITNARIGFERERWLLQLFARNLFDEAYAVRGFFFGNEPPDFPPTLYTRQGDPRQLGVSIDVRF